MQQMQRHGFDPWVGEIPQRRAWQHTAVILTGWFHGGLKSAGHDWGSKQWPQQICFHPFILNPLAFIFDVSSGFLIVRLYLIHVVDVVVFTERTICLLKIVSRILASHFIPSSWTKIPSSIIDFIFQSSFRIEWKAQSFEAGYTGRLQSTKGQHLHSPQSSRVGHNCIDLAHRHTPLIPTPIAGFLSRSEDACTLWTLTLLSSTQKNCWSVWVLVAWALDLEICRGLRCHKSHFTCFLFFFYKWLST